MRFKKDKRVLSVTLKRERVSVSVLNGLLPRLRLQSSDFMFYESFNFRRALLFMYSFLVALSLSKSKFIRFGRNIQLFNMLDCTIPSPWGMKFVSGNIKAD